MKKIILSLTLLLTVSMSAFAQGFSYNGINYKFLSAEDKTVEVDVSLSFNGSELIIPDKVINKYTQKEYTVTGIGESAFLAHVHFSVDSLLCSLTEEGWHR